MSLAFCTLSTVCSCPAFHPQEPSMRGLSVGSPSLYSCLWLPQPRYSFWMETSCVKFVPSSSDHLTRHCQEQPESVHATLPSAVCTHCGEPLRHFSPDWWAPAVPALISPPESDRCSKPLTYLAPCTVAFSLPKMFDHCFSGQFFGGITGVPSPSITFNLFASLYFSCWFQDLCELGSILSPGVTEDNIAYKVTKILQSTSS